MLDFSATKLRFGINIISINVVLSMHFVFLQRSKQGSSARIFIQGSEDGQKVS